MQSVILLSVLWSSWTLAQLLWYFLLSLGAGHNTICFSHMEWLSDKAEFLTGINFWWPQHWMNIRDKINFFQNNKVHERGRKGGEHQKACPILQNLLKFPKWGFCFTSERRRGVRATPRHQRVAWALITFPEKPCGPDLVAGISQVLARISTFDLRKYIQIKISGNRRICVNNWSWEKWKLVARKPFNRKISL